MGGAPTSMLNIIRYLDKNKFSAKILFIFENPSICEICKKENIDYRVLKGKFFQRFYNLNVYSEANETSWRYQLRLYPFLRNIISWIFVGFYFSKNIIKEEEPDIIHFNSTFLTDWLWGVRHLNVKRFVHVREPFSSRGIGIKKYIYKFILRNYTDGIFAISDDNKRRLGLPDITEVIYNFMPEPLFKRLEAKQNQVNVIYLGGDSKIKGFKILKEARHYIDPDIMIYVAGHFLNPDCIPNYTNMKYLGVITNVYEYLIQSDILIFPSMVPHFAKPIIEAGMCRLPVIASNVNGMEEIVTPEQNGILFPVGDARALAKAINFLASNLQLRLEYGNNNYKMVKNKFSIETNLRLIENAYLS